MSKETNITIVYVQAGRKAEIITVENTLSTFQNLVGGRIEVLYPFQEEVAVVACEDGKVFGHRPNRAICADANISNEIIDIVFGDFFICGAPVSEENFTSLTKELQRKYISSFLYPEKFHVIDSKTITIIREID